MQGWLRTTLGKAADTGGAALVQDAAIESTKARINSNLEASVMPNMQYITGCHSNLQQYVGSCRAKLVCFNLGYLPAGDKQLITQASTTSAAIEAALEVVRPGGLVSIVAYTRHPGAMEELQAVQDLLSSLTTSYWTCTQTQQLNRPNAPVLMFVWRRVDVLPPLLR